MTRNIFRDPVLRRYAKIDSEGRKTIKKSPETIEEASPYSEKYKDRFHTSLLFSPESIKLLQERVIDRIVEIAAKLGIGLMVAGQDYSVHSTLKDGYYQGENNIIRDQAFNRLRQDSGFEEISELVEGKTIKYKYLLIDKGNVLLTCHNIPAVVENVRGRIIQKFEGEQIKPLSYENILHITAARIKGFPMDKTKREVFKQFKQELVKLRHEISSDPLSLEVVGIFKTDSWDLLTNKQYVKDQQEDE